VWSLQANDTNYRGLKTHAKKIVAYVEKAQKADFTEEQLEHLCHALGGLGQTKRVTRAFLALGQRRFPHSPYFPYLEALTYFKDGPAPDSPPRGPVRPLLEKAQRLARALPPDDRRDALLRDVEHRLRLLAVLNPFAGGIFGRMFGGFPGFPGDFFDDEDEDD